MVSSSITDGGESKENLVPVDELFERGVYVAYIESEATSLPYA